MEITGERSAAGILREATQEKKQGHSPPMNAPEHTVSLQNLSVYSIPCEYCPVKQKNGQGSPLPAVSGY